MPHTASTNSVIRQLQLVFSISTLLLLLSLVASFFSIQRLIEQSKRVTHTQEILVEAENVISAMKDAETGQRGYLLTLDPQFLTPYTGSQARVQESYQRLRRLTTDNAAQQRNIDEIKALSEAKFAQMQRIIDLAERSRAFRQDTLTRHQEMTRGMKIMNDLRRVVDRSKAAEQELLRQRMEAQQFYITYAPLLLVISALISMLITAFAYVRIKKDLDERLVQQQLAEERYRETNRRISVMEGLTRAIAGGRYDVRSDDQLDDDLGRIAGALNRMAQALEETFTKLTRQNWLQAGTVRLGDAIRGERDAHRLADRLIKTIAELLGAPLGTVYLMDDDAYYRLVGQYAVQEAPAQLRAGEGLVGQAIAQQQPLVVEQVPAHYSPIRSSLGAAVPTALYILPLLYDEQCIGVIELGLLRAPTDQERELLTRNAESLAIGVKAALDYVRLQNLLGETQAQAEELQVQHRELESLNAELEMQTQKLQASEEELRVQQEELQQTNAELEERGVLLEERNTEIQKKADELELATRYKSEFLANMSHELRTPLNSILLLSRLLAENLDKNLQDEQVEYARVIQSSGNGLLSLIDEILDLSKIEAGQMKLEYRDVGLADITDELESLFRPLAREKGLDWGITVEAEVPTHLETDRQRLGQILKNLLANALKFTSSGSVTLRIAGVPDRPGQLAFAVRDTGIGIPADKQPLVFEAFQQADGSTRRKYGGTGLGLSISRELARLLGGDIALTSEVGVGSTFTLYVPARPGVPVPPPPPPVPSAEVPPARPPGPVPYRSAAIPEAIPDDRHTLTAADKAILIVEDDPHFARSLLNYARKQGYKGIVAVRGDEAVPLAERHRPVGILLDIELPVLSGMEVMDALKNNPLTRPIPVHMMSSHRLKNESLRKGAIDFLDKPAAYEQMQAVFRKIEQFLSRNPQKVLIVEENTQHARALAYYLETFNITSELKSNVSEGISALSRQEASCVILDMGVPDSSAYATLEEVRKTPGLENLPIIIFTGKSLSMAEELKIKKYADSIIVKTAHSYQRMLDEVSLFLHVVQENQQPGTERGRGKGALSQVLAGKKVLITDDDVRNIFSLSKALEQFDITVVAALDGREALQKLTEHPDIDLVLLDMMMPQMDGYETARAIRDHPQWRHLPVIAVTAKAMTGDRQKCIDAGASDYVTKPIDIDQLISLLRVWLYDRK
jgi:signal transduction histidine kinase/CheY-like chemotaxis protein/CHASE3 domain sensor protein